MQIVAKDVFPLLEYGRRLTALAEALEPGVGEAWRACRFTDLSWVPKRVRVCLEDAEGWDDTAAKIAAVVERERLALQRAVAKRQRTCPETLDLLLRLRADAPALLAGDTWELGRTRFLPPTPSLPDARSDLEAFLQPAAELLAQTQPAAAELLAQTQPAAAEGSLPLDGVHEQPVVPGPVHAGEAQAGGAHVE